jgi:hypothetical protein
MQQPMTVTRKRPRFRWPRRDPWTGAAAFLAQDRAEQADRTRRALYPAYPLRDPGAVADGDGLGDRMPMKVAPRIAVANNPQR